jgi:glycerate 2-kinase
LRRRLGLGESASFGSTSAREGDIEAMLPPQGMLVVEMHTVRKRVSIVEGGRLARLTAPARILHIEVSDVSGNPLDYIPAVR